MSQNIKRIAQLRIFNTPLINTLDNSFTQLPIYQALINNPICRPTTKLIYRPHNRIMAAKYAKDQPAGFTNRIERVAIVGVSVPT